MKQQMVLITPPLFPKEHPVEREEFKGIPCTYCHGQGWFWGIDGRNRRVEIKCPVCKGHKKLKAVVTIRWKADEDK